MKNKKETRYIPSWGLAFAEELEMKKLSSWARKGWLFESFAFLGFKLRRGEAQNLIYSLDYNSVNPNELEDYYDTFRAAGWEIVSSLSNIHVFSAKPGTVPIYTDRSTSYDKYSRAVVNFKWISLIFGLLTLIGFAASYYSGTYGSGTVLPGIFLTAATLCLVIAIPSLMIYCAYKIRKSKSKL